MCKTLLYIFTIIVLLVCSFFLLPVSGVQETASKSVYWQLMERLERLTPTETIEVKMGTAKEKYEVGEPFELRFLTSKDCYPVLMDISANDRHPEERYVTFLLPNRRFPEVKIEAERVYSTLYDFDMNITIGPPYGIETLNLFCSAQKIDLFEADFEKVPYYTIKPDDKEQFKTLLERLEHLKQHEWSGNSVTFWVGKRRPGFKPENPGYTFGTIQSTGEKFFPPIDTTGTTGKR